MEYWKPEQPPPTTPMRRPAGSGSWVAMISRTLTIACGVSVSGAFFTVSSGVAIAVAMVLSQLMNLPVLTVSPRGPGYKSQEHGYLIGCAGVRPVAADDPNGECQARRLKRIFTIEKH